MSKKVAAKCLNVLTWIFLGYGVLFFGLVPGIGFDNLDSNKLIIHMAAGFSLALICKFIAQKLDQSESGKMKSRKSPSSGFKMAIYIISLPFLVSLGVCFCFMIYFLFIK